jgi:hypothetical protein
MTGFTSCLLKEWPGFGPGHVGVEIKIGCAVTPKAIGHFRPTGLQPYSKLLSFTGTLTTDYT